MILSGGCSRCTVLTLIAVPIPAISSKCYKLIYSAYYCIIISLVFEYSTIVEKLMRNSLLLLELYCKLFILLMQWFFGVSVQIFTLFKELSNRIWQGKPVSNGLSCFLLICRLIFLKFFASILGGYRNFIVWILILYLFVWCGFCCFINILSNSLYKIVFFSQKIVTLFYLTLNLNYNSCFYFVL